jgi:hypothetical protein
MVDNEPLRDAIDEGNDIWREYCRLLSHEIWMASSKNSPSSSSDRNGQGHSSNKNNGVVAASSSASVVTGLPTVLTDLIIDYLAMAILPWPHSMSTLVCHTLHRSLRSAHPELVGVPAVHTPPSAAAAADENHKDDGITVHVPWVTPADISEAFPPLGTL